ncbi:1,3-beta-glucanosyltransferase gel2 [Nannizzia gypsea CBS 118893]|uniref:1,3-beta-glucanosyltransferase n=1 Tax=Arthroderma gypseum (strain ATCC MYA-4604 / CBS 118893) TaxID=535722 RepID=E5R2T8_ARTGP|nr:1,3-beta-glucanosyltransferase gel2 [Nannizzia gypsea CBS 118893]EFQ97072.1 1,3-beta-glucanosyltransferase gel2 [Nannizzia gypsea CBS 118893]
MKKFAFLASLCGLLSAVAAVTPVEVQGSQFVNPKTKARFQMIGVDYQPGGSSGYKPESGKDPLSNADDCLRDAILLQRLGVNTIRIYNLDPSLNHDECVSIFNAAGIYLLLDVSTPIYGEYLNRAEPGPSYTKQFLTRIFSMVEAFKDYPNLLGFFGGNEVINEDAAKDVPAYIRAIQRDLKDYIAAHASRKIPVGYSAADVRDILKDSWNYVTCDSSEAPSSNADFFGVNSYSWCGDSSYTKSGYDKLVEIFSTTSVPVFFSEYGCNEVKPRIFTEVQAVYGPEMTKAMCGGLIYEYSQEDNEYGLVKLGGKDNTTLLVDYDNLYGQFKKLDIKKLQSLDPSTTTVKPPTCKSSLITSGNFHKKFTIPKRPSGVNDLIKDGIKNPPKGKLVEVKKTKTDTKVFTKDGKILSNLELKLLEDDQANVPGENTSGTPTEDPNAPGSSKPPHSGAGTNIFNSHLTYIVAGIVALGQIVV